ncbi:Rieske (2Fe-2S) protein [Streptomyces sp. 6N223]|uniref:Rieske (2Fe-2S) protein n=1 Tax=Streptomyces sp. 6N223 TaxID=3457412 RepID=UPI003FCF474D
MRAVVTSRRLVVVAGAAGLASALAGCGSGDGDGGGEVLGDVSEIPEGGGRVFADAQVVVVQPAAGEFLGFSAICTHQGCTVADVSDGTINCHCHGSRFRITDGGVERGPAERPLPEEAITVRDGTIRLR